MGGPPTRRSPPWSGPRGPAGVLRRSRSARRARGSTTRARRPGRHLADACRGRAVRHLRRPRAWLLRRPRARERLPASAPRDGSGRGVFQRSGVRTGRGGNAASPIHRRAHHAGPRSMSGTKVTRGERARPDAPIEKEDVMGRTKEQSRGRLAALQDILAGGGKALVDQAQNLGAGVQQRLAEIARGIETQVTTLIAGLEERLSDRLDVLLDRLAVSLRRDVERVRERVRAVENRLADVPKEGVRELLAPLQAIASGAGERASAALARIEELSVRLQHTERRIAELTRESARDTLDASDLLQRLDRSEHRLTDLGREVGTKLGELGALRERLTRMEGRVVESSKEQIARSGEAAGFRDRLTRLEGRLSDLSKEQLARAVETAGLRERLFRVEQHGGTAAAPGRS